jgi:plastocyanin
MLGAGWAACLVGCLVACGGDNKRPDTTATTPAPSPTGAAPVAGGAAAAVTGKTWDVKMFGDATGYRFEPVDLAIKVGDGVRWTVVNGAPHNVTFWSDSIPANAAARLQPNMGQTAGPLTGEMLMNPSQTYLVSFAGLPPGEYHYYCTPHLAYNMKGVITVQ